MALNLDFLSNLNIEKSKVMSVVILLMVMSIVVAGIFLVAYLWSAKSGQFDDPDANANRILHDTELVNKAKSTGA
jgi:cbb3-type cytochrome oxidase maturation protein